MNKFIYITLTLAVVATALSQAAPNVGEYEDVHKAFDDDDSDFNNLLIPYLTPKRVNVIDRRDSANDRQHKNVIPTGSRVSDLERESSTTFELPNSDSTASQQAADEEMMKSIAFNNREVKLVGPDNREVEVKSDVATHLMLALENLQKEATNVLGQVNKGLDKGWTELKTMIDNASKKSNIPTSSSRHLRETTPKDVSSLVMVSDIDGYSMADEDLSKQAESAGSKIKGFLSNIGINEENGKKANEALTKAGASVSETVTKDIPDALKKAGTAVSETVTKDIPEAFKNFFG